MNAEEEKKPEAGSKEGGAAPKVQPAAGKTAHGKDRSAAASQPDELLLVSCSPHMRSPETTSAIMWTVVIALVPAMVMGLYVFGWRALGVIVLSAASAVAAEAIFQRVRGIPVTVHDGSAAVTGVLLALVLPPTVRWYVPVVGAAFAVIIGKQAFGGLGHNIFNPALLGRAFLQFGFPSQVSLSKWAYLYPRGGVIEMFSRDITSTGAAGNLVDATTTATPLALLKSNPGVAWEEIAGHFPARDVITGYIPGCIGEVSVAALLLGGIILLCYRCINWRLPLAYVASAALLLWLLPVKGADGALAGGLAGILHGELFLDRLLIQVCSGGLMLGAIFMITDMVTSPITKSGQVIYGIGAGILVALIRLYGGYPEGVCYSILLMNAVRPLIERLTVPKVFGAKT